VLGDLLPERLFVGALRLLVVEYKVGPLGHSTIKDFQETSMTSRSISRDENAEETDVQSETVLSEEKPTELRAIGPIERANLATLLEHVANRISSLESKTVTKPHEDKETAKTLIELAKVLFGGWPAFGLVFLVLFYGPLRDAINAIPEKVKTAEEIGVLGMMSLKTTLRVEAEKMGAVQLSETLPALTPSAVELLLRASRESNLLIAFGYNSSGLLSTVVFPSEQLISTLEELEFKKLITVHTGGPIDNPEGVKKLRDEIVEFRKLFPGKELLTSMAGQVMWQLDSPQKAEIPKLSWRLTDLGKKAVDVILKAVSSQLSPQNAKTTKASK
jgi:hypothetical protein